MGMIMVRRGPSRSVAAFRRAAPAVTRTRTRVVRVGSRVGRAAIKKAWDHKHTIAAVATGAVVGYMKKNGQLQTLPHVKTLGVTGTYGLVAAIGGAYIKSPTLQHIGTGLLTLAAAAWAADEEMMGEPAGHGAGGSLSAEDIAAMQGEGEMEGEGDETSGAAADMGEEVEGEDEG